MSGISEKEVRDRYFQIYVALLQTLAPEDVRHNYRGLKTIALEITHSALCASCDAEDFWFGSDEDCE